MALAYICIWTLVVTALAPLPVRYQIAPAVLLLLILPVLLVWLARDFGTLPVLLCVIAVVSLFRIPLREGIRIFTARLTRD